MKISIVTLSFNQRAYLQEAMESVLVQAYPELEYIVIDPGSTDGSRELIESYSDRISQIVFEKDRGAADGLNKGFSFASGEVYGFLNADDLLMPGSLRRVAGFFQTHPECDLVLGDGHIIDGKGNRIRDIKARDFTVRRYCYGGTNWLQQSTFFRREAFLSSPKFNIDNRTCWDGELFVNLVNEGARVGYIHSDLSAFRIHQSSISGSGRMWEAYQKDCMRIFKQMQGRDWRATDEVWKLLYRCEGLLIRAGSWFRNSTKRNAA